MINPDLFKCLDPDAIYTGKQVIEITGISKTTFYRNVREEKIRKHIRSIDRRPVFLGSDLLSAFRDTEEVMPTVYFIRPRRGRPPKKQANP